MFAVDTYPTYFEQARYKFADRVVDTAAQCEDNDEFLTRIRESLPEPLAYLGEGRTRRTYLYKPLGLVIKVQREDPVDDPMDPSDVERDCAAIAAYAEENGVSCFAGDHPQGYNEGLHFTRRIANFQEAMAAIVNPLLLPRQFGFLCSFGIRQMHPSVLVSEVVDTLDRLFPNIKGNIQRKDIALENGRIVDIFDKRLTNKRRPKGFPGDEPGDMQLANIGRTVRGDYVLCDGSSFVCAERLLNLTTLCPCTWDLFQPTPQQNLWFSRHVLYQMYREKGGAYMRGETTTQTSEVDVTTTPATGYIPNV